VRLRVLASAVFKDKYKDTSEWIPRSGGGFTTDELEYAVESCDLPEMRRMYQVLRRIVGEVLRAKLAIGLGNTEIRLLRRFDQTTWRGRRFHWSDKALTLINDSDREIKLAITLLTDTSGGKAGENVRFTLFKRGKFVWFVPKGRYSVESTLKSKVSIKKKSVSLLTRDFTLILRDGVETSNQPE
jgi:hypothetical protein